MTAPITPTALWSAPLTIVMTGYDFGDGQPPQISGVIQLDAGLAGLGFPAIKGDPGPTGAPGIPAVVQASSPLAGPANLPAGLNNSTDVGKAWFTVSDGVLNVWTGSTWAKSGSLKGPIGPQASIGSASDFTGVAVAPGATLRGGPTAGTVIAQPATSLAVERSQTNQTNTQSGTPTPVTFDGVVRSQGSAITWGGAGNGSYPTRVVFGQAGMYRVRGRVTHSNSSNAAFRCASLRQSSSAGSVLDQVDGQTQNGNSAGIGNGSSGGPYGLISTVEELVVASAGDFVELMGWQNSNGNLDMIPGRHGLRLSAEYVGP